MEFRRIYTALAAAIEVVVMVVLSASIHDRRWRNPVMAALLLGVPVEVLRSQRRWLSCTPTRT